MFFLQTCRLYICCTNMESHIFLFNCTCKRLIRHPFWVFFEKVSDHSMDTSDHANRLDGYYIVWECRQVTGAVLDRTCHHEFTIQSHKILNCRASWNWSFTQLTSKLYVLIGFYYAFRKLSSCSICHTAVNKDQMMIFWPTCSRLNS